ncbi:prohibitin family protein [Oceanithermus sp.]
MTKRGQIAVGGLGLLLVLVGLWIALGVRIVDNRNVGCRIRLGQIQTNETPPGVHWVMVPIETLAKVPIHTRILDYQGVEVLAKDGLRIHMDITVGYKIKPQMACDAYLQYTDIERGLVVPEIRSALRKVASLFLSTEYYEKRSEVDAKIVMALEELENPYFEIVQVNIRNVVLPDSVVQAIQRKIVAKQEAERMQFVLQREEKEAERKKIEAQGIAEANRMIAGSLTENYLKWYQIQAIKDLGQSPSNTFMVVPYDSGLFPVPTYPLPGSPGTKK